MKWEYAHNIMLNGKRNGKEYDFKSVSNNRVEESLQGRLDGSVLERPPSALVTVLGSWVWAPRQAFCSADILLLHFPLFFFPIHTLSISSK